MGAGLKTNRDVGFRKSLIEEWISPMMVLKGYPGVQV
jgi:hypothetical protein